MLEVLMTEKAFVDEIRIVLKLFPDTNKIVKLIKDQQTQKTMLSIIHNLRTIYNSNKFILLYYSIFH